VTGDDVADIRAQADEACRWQPGQGFNPGDAVFPAIAGEAVCGCQQTDERVGAVQLLVEQIAKFERIGEGAGEPAIADELGKMLTVVVGLQRTGRGERFAPVGK
jgi:hypothetical protein